MCRPATCRTCTRTTWAGCGQHVDQVMRRVPEDARCTCDPGTIGKQGDRGSLLARILGR